MPESTRKALLPDDGLPNRALALIASPSDQQLVVAGLWVFQHAHQNPDLECALEFLPAAERGIIAARGSLTVPLTVEAIAGVLAIFPNGNVSLECGDRATADAFFAQICDLEGSIRVAISEPASVWLRPRLLERYQLVSEHWPLVMVCDRPPEGAEGRWATLGDRSALQAYVEAYSAERGGNTHIDWERLIQNRRVAVLEHNGQIAAAVRYTTTARHAIVLGTFTFKPFRQQGLGKRLIAFLTAELLKEQAQVKLWVDEDNEAAIALYRSVGFDPIGQLYTGRFTSRSISRS